MSSKHSEIMEVGRELTALESELLKMLPSHISPERFTRVAVTAIQKNPALLGLNRKSLFESCMACASDGLLPDGKQAALVPYKGNVQYLPMIAGLKLKVQQSGDVNAWDSRVVYEADEFYVEYGDDERIVHKPDLFAADRGDIVAVYSIARLKNGEKSREVMTAAEVEEIRKFSRGTNTPWNVKAFYPEMCRKTVMHRHSKNLPLSADVERVIHRDDAFYELPGSAEERVLVQESAGKKKKKAPTSFDQLIAERPALTYEPEADYAPQAGEEAEAETIEAQPVKAARKPAAKRQAQPEEINESGPVQSPRKGRAAPAGQEGSPSPAPAGAAPSRFARAEDDGYEAFAQGLRLRDVPEEYAEDRALTAAWKRGWQRASDSRREDDE